MTYIFFTFVRKLSSMDTKLTLRLDKNVIERAKDYAKLNNTSLSKLFEAYLASITEQKTGEIAITPLVESLSGVVSLSEDFDYKKDYADYLNKKYQ